MSASTFFSRDTRTGTGPRDGGDAAPFASDFASGIHTPKVLLSGLASGSSLATQDAGPSWTTSLGVSGARVTSADASGSDLAITDAPGASLKAVLTDLILSTDTAMRVDLKEETSGTVLASFYLGANSTVNVVTRGKLKLATANKKFMVRASAAGNLSITPLWYTEP